MIGWVGNDMKDLSIALYAEFAGCAQSLRSTSGSHMHIQGKRTRFPLAGGSKRQGCVSHSTPEAEIVAADVTLRTQYLGNAYRFISQSRDDWCGSFWKKSNNAASGKNSSNFFYVIT